MVRRWVVIKQGKDGWVKLAPMGTYGRPEDPPKAGEVLGPVPMGAARRRCDDA